MTTSSYDSSARGMGDNMNAGGLVEDAELPRQPPETMNIFDIMEEIELASMVEDNRDINVLMQLRELRQIFIPHNVLAASRIGADLMKLLDRFPTTSEVHKLSAKIIASWKACQPSDKPAQGSRVGFFDDGECPPVYYKHDPRYVKPAVAGARQHLQGRPAVGLFNNSSRKSNIATSHQLLAQHEDVETGYIASHSEESFVMSPENKRKRRSDESGEREKDLQNPDRGNIGDSMDAQMTTDKATATSMIPANGSKKSDVGAAESLPEHLDGAVAKKKPMTFLKRRRRSEALDLVMSMETVDQIQELPTSKNMSPGKDTISSYVGAADGKGRKRTRKGGERNEGGDADNNINTTPRATKNSKNTALKKPKKLPKKSCSEVPGLSSFLEEFALDAEAEEESSTKMQAMKTAEKKAKNINMKSKSSINNMKTATSSKSPSKVVDSPEKKRKKGMKIKASSGALGANKKLEAEDSYDEGYGADDDGGRSSATSAEKQRGRGVAMKIKRATKTKAKDSVAMVPSTTEGAPSSAMKRGTMKIQKSR